MASSSAESESSIWRAAGARAAAVTRLLPQRSRYLAAVRMSRALALVLRRAPHFRLLVEAKLDTSREIALHLLMHVMSTNDVSFDPDLVIDGYDEFLEALRAGRGLLLVAPHASLGLTLLRRFHDDGLRPIVLGPDPDMRVVGTSARVATIQRSPAYLVRARTKLREGRLVGTMLDRAEPEPGTKVFDTARGPVIFAPGLLHVAARCGSPVALCETHLDGTRLRARIVLATSGTGAGYEREFMEFVCSAIHRRNAGVPLDRN